MWAKVKKKKKMAKEGNDWNSLDNRTCYGHRGVSLVSPGTFLATKVQVE